MNSLLCSAVLWGLAIDAPRRLPRSAPEAQGVSSAALLAFVEEADRKIDAVHSVMVLRHGQVIAEGWWKPYDAATKHELYSLSKSFTSTAVGLAIAEGKLSLDDEVAKRFPQDAPKNPSAHLKAMRLRDLLCMSTGHQVEPAMGLNGVATEPWTKVFLAQPVNFKPGTHFLYNTPATYMQSALVQQATGQTVLDYLKPRLFDPLGIEGQTWGTSPQGVSLGGYGLNLRTEDIAKFGQMLLQKGQWHGQQLVPAAWIAAATARQTSNGSSPTSDWDQGYGYQFWRNRPGGFRGDGAFGQFCIVLPEHDAVVAMTSGTGNMQGEMNLVWDKLLPAFGPLPLPADSAATERLAAKLSSLSLPTPKAAAAPPPDVAGKRFRFPVNPQRLEELALEFDPARPGATLVVKSAGQPDQRVACGSGQWSLGKLALGAQPARPVEASGAWTGERRFTAKLCYRETPFISTVELDFADGKLRYLNRTNVGFGNPRAAPLVGEPIAP